VSVLVAEKLGRTLDGEVPVTLVQDADVTIERGEFVVIRGPSGSGKSSLLYLLGLLDKPTSEADVRSPAHRRQRHRRLR